MARVGSVGGGEGGGRRRVGMEIGFEEMGMEGLGVGRGTEVGACFEENNALNSWVHNLDEQVSAFGCTGPSFSLPAVLSSPLVCGVAFAIVGQKGIQEFGTRRLFI
ncbi:hypothetical protein GYH30_009880 [Glycine max]|nr:hypothetical protein GYH30_009880 [Glycine max]